MLRLSRCLNAEIQVEHMNGLKTGSRALDVSSTNLADSGQCFSDEERVVDFDEQEREREREVCRLLFMEFGRGLAIPSLESGSTHYIIIVYCVFGVWPVAMEHSKET
ncbi:hypothetical protein DPX16_17469 [Anabarilius grahami]|uniref:Uncharacterized protein n=1 Tax=Anabarilius grahami TaxID=495550 RepID=A0A3N0XZD1_ANAGA|nr:hypothetical protein DPX16_17469 [Anabarilius grahami]